MRYNLTSLRLRYDINPLVLRRAYRLLKANIAPEGNIANPVRDLYRCDVPRRIALFDLAARIIVEQNFFIIFPLHCHIVGAVLTHSDTVTVAADSKSEFPA